LCSCDITPELIAVNRVWHWLLQGGASITSLQNNLFHGGKFNGQWFEPERSEALMEHALTILKICAQNHPNVSEAYAEKSF